MPWLDDDNHPFAGIVEKLKRADENIVSLNNEIVGFFGNCKYPVVPAPSADEWQEAVDYHRNLNIPIRFSVLSGEVIHHLRSCLDHITWIFSSSDYRRDNHNSITFLILANKPTKKDLVRYRRNVGGIGSANVQAIIENLQPYKTAHPLDNPLCIIHDMDRYDKHRELAIISSRAGVTLPPNATPEAIRALCKLRDKEDLSSADRDVAREALHSDAKVTPQLAFAQFKERRAQLVVPALTELLYAIRDVVEKFAEEI